MTRIEELHAGNFLRLVRDERWGEPERVRLTRCQSCPANARPRMAGPGLDMAIPFRQGWL